MYTYVKIFKANIIQTILQERVNKWLENYKHYIEVIDIKVDNENLIIIYKANKAY